MIRALAIVMLLAASPARAGGVDIENLPARLGCPVVRVMYKHYQKQGFTRDQMVAYMRAKGISEARIAGLQKCVVTS